MRTIKLKAITIILLTCFVLVRSQELILDCNGRSSICVGPLSYKTCENNGYGLMLTHNEFVYICPPGTRCVDNGDDSCAPLQVTRDDGIDARNVTSLHKEILDNDDQNPSSSKTIRDINNHTTTIPSVTEITTIDSNKTNDTNLTTDITDVKETDGVEANTQQTTDDIVLMANTTVEPDTTTSNLQTGSTLSLTTNSQPITITLNPEDVTDASLLIDSNDTVAQADSITDATESILLEQSSDFDTTVNPLESNDLTTIKLTTVLNTESLFKNSSTTTTSTNLPVENATSLTSDINVNLNITSSAVPQNNSVITEKSNRELSTIENRQQLPQDQELVGNDTTTTGEEAESNPEQTTISLITHSVEQVTDFIETTTLQPITNPLQEGVNNNNVTVLPKDQNKSLVDGQKISTTVSYPTTGVSGDSSQTHPSSTVEVSTATANAQTKDINSSRAYDRPENISHIQTLENVNEIDLHPSTKNSSNDQNLHEIKHTATTSSETLELLFNGSQTQSTSSSLTNELNLNNVTSSPSELFETSRITQQAKTNESPNVFQIYHYPAETESNLHESNVYIKNTSRISLLGPEGESYLKTLLKLKIALNELKTNGSSVPSDTEGLNLMPYKIQNKTVLTFDPINGIVIKNYYKKVYEYPQTTTLSPAVFDSSSTTISSVKLDSIAPELPVSVLANSDSVTLRPAVSSSKISDSNTLSSLKPDSVVSDPAVPITSNSKISRPAITNPGTSSLAEHGSVGSDSGMSTAAQSSSTVFSPEILPAASGSVVSKLAESDSAVLIPAASAPVGSESTILSPTESVSAVSGPTGLKPTIQDPIKSVLTASGPGKSNSSSHDPTTSGLVTSGSETTGLSRSNSTFSSSTIKQEKKSPSSSSSSSNNNSSNISKEKDDSKSDESKKSDDNESDLSKSELKKLLKKYKKMKFRCSEEGIYPDSLDCRKYYRCVKKENDTSSESDENKIKLKKHTFKCPDYQLFDPEVLKCVYSDNIKCVVHKA